MKSNICERYSWSGIEIEQGSNIEFLPNYAKGDLTTKLSLIRMCVLY